MADARVLIIEDEPDLGNLLHRGLTEENFTATVVTTGAEALRKLNSDWDLVILDLMLPDMTGQELVRHITAQNFRPPILVLTAVSNLEEKVAVFDLGCDDYLTKPFAFEELLSRVRALLRRNRISVPAESSYEDMRLNQSDLSLSVSKKMIRLTPKEFQMCRLFLSKAGQIVSRQELLHVVWGYSIEPKTNFLEVHMANLRKKLSSVGRSHWIKTIRFSGFIFANPEQAATA